jgi:hypothetical protein
MGFGSLFLVMVTTLTTEGTWVPIFFAVAVAASPPVGVVAAVVVAMVVGVLVDGLDAGVVLPPHPVRARTAAAISVVGSPTFMVCLSWSWWW